MWLGSGTAVAVAKSSAAALIPPLAQELLNATSVAIKKEKKSYIIYYDTLRN